MGVRQGGWRERGGEHGLRAQIELAKEVFMERPFDAKRARCVFDQHDDPVILRRSAPGDRERAGELTQVERVLDGVELEALARWFSTDQSLRRVSCGLRPGDLRSTSALRFYA